MEDLETTEETAVAWAGAGRDPHHDFQPFGNYLHGSRPPTISGEAQVTHEPEAESEFASFKFEDENNIEDPSQKMKISESLSQPVSSYSFFDSEFESVKIENKNGIENQSQKMETCGNLSRPVSPYSFITATSRSGSYITAPSFMSSDPSKSSSVGKKSRFQALLELGKSQSDRPSPIRPTPPITISEPWPKELNKRSFDELDWCGRGMHVDFKAKEIVPLQLLSDLVGRGSTASVDIVRCRRVKLARKTVILPPNKKLTPQLLQEVLALHRLSQAHIVRLVGTYIHGRKFATLLYPAAEMNLEEYLEEIQSDCLDLGPLERSYDPRFRHFKIKPNPRQMLSEGSVCLTSGLRYLHASGVNHSDIKPANIILKEVNSRDFRHLNSSEDPQKCYKMYFCDFGISRILDLNGESQTEEDRGKTPRYASPEVMSGDLHGRSSDIYSFGYVLAEMATVYSGRLIRDFRNYIQFDPFEFGGITPQIIEETSAPFRAYHTHYKPDQIKDWFSYGFDMKVSNQIIRQMMHEDPKLRPQLYSSTDPQAVILEIVCEHNDKGAPLFESEN